MKNLAYKDIVGGPIYEYTAHKDLPRWERFKLAYEELAHMACINLYYVKRNKVKKISRRSINWYNKRKYM